MVDARIKMFPADGSDRKTLRREKMLNMSMCRQEGMGAMRGFQAPPVCEASLLLTADKRTTLSD